jgi:hypothetical protein
MLSAMVIAVPALAQSVTTFDGTYNGVSYTASGGRSCVPPVPVPRPLTIKNGAAQFAGGLTGDMVFQGNVAAQGNLTMRSSLGSIFTGKVDPSGKISGGVGSAGGSCNIMGVWQKQ